MAFWGLDRAQADSYELTNSNMVVLSDAPAFEDAPGAGMSVRKSRLPSEIRSTFRPSTNLHFRKSNASELDSVYASNAELGAWDPSVKPRRSRYQPANLRSRDDRGLDQGSALDVDSVFASQNATARARVSRKKNSVFNEQPLAGRKGAPEKDKPGKNFRNLYELPFAGVNEVNLIRGAHIEYYKDLLSIDKKGGLTRGQVPAQAGQERLLDALRKVLPEPAQLLRLPGRGPAGREVQRAHPQLARAGLLPDRAAADAVHVPVLLRRVPGAQPQDPARAAEPVHRGQAHQPAHPRRLAGQSALLPEVRVLAAVQPDPQGARARAHQPLPRLAVPGQRCAHQTKPAATASSTRKAPSSACATRAHSRRPPPRARPSTCRTSTRSTSASASSRARTSAP